MAARTVSARGMARRLGVPPRVIRWLVDAGVLYSPRPGRVRLASPPLCEQERPPKETWVDPELAASVAPPAAPIDRPSLAFGERLDPRRSARYRRWKWRRK